MLTLLMIIAGSFVITLCVWVAVFFIFLKKEVLSRITMFLVALSAGALMGGAFLHLMPETSDFFCCLLFNRKTSSLATLS